MAVLMILLLIVPLLLIWIILGNTEREPDWRLALIQSLIVWAAYLVIGTEILSWFSAIHKVSLIIFWSLPILLGWGWIWWWLKRGKILRLPVVYHRDSWAGTILDLFVILILVITAVVALVAPPNSSNALIYRMSRVAHWAQAETVAHYPTEIESQNSNAPGAELVQLNLYVLTDGDRTANLVAWMAFAGTIAAAASLAEVFGARVNGQRMAAIFAATIPVAITQASSSLNDIVVSFWVVCTALMLMIHIRKSAKPLYLVLAAFSAALAILTKSTAILFLWPLGLYILIVLRKRMGITKMALWGLIAVVIMAVLNGGHFWRNQQAYGQFYRPAELAHQTNEVRNWRVLTSNISRNAALHADLPFPRADRWLRSHLDTVHDLLALPIDDPRTTLGSQFYIPAVNTSEQTSGNPLHAAMVLISFVAVVGMVILGKQDGDILAYTSTIFLSLILFCYLLKWQPEGSRLHLPFFILFAPVVGLFLDRLAKFKVETVIAVLLLVYAIPWLFQTEERPILPAVDRTYPVSIFEVDRESLYFTTRPAYFPIYEAITAEISARGVTRLGLDLTEQSLEYPFWAMLGTPGSAVEIEWVPSRTLDFNDSAGTAFKPQAIVCESCNEADIRRYQNGGEVVHFSDFDLIFPNP